MSNAIILYLIEFLAVCNALKVLYQRIPLVLLFSKKYGNYRFCVCFTQILVLLCWCWALMLFIGSGNGSAVNGILLERLDFQHVVSISVLFSFSLTLSDMSHFLYFFSSVLYVLRISVYCIHHSSDVAASSHV